MKNCLAFSALVGSRDAWRPCSRRAIAGSEFCGRHTEVAAGVMLGVCVHGLLDRGDITAKVTPSAKRKPSAPAALPATRRSPKRLNVLGGARSHEHQPHHA